MLGGLDERMSSAFYAVSHREYPIGLPALEAFDFHAMGGADAQMIHVQFVLMLAAVLATAWSLLRPHADAALLVGALCLLVAAPSLHTQVLAAYADVPLACCWVAAVLAVGLWLQEGRGDLLLLGGLFAAGALAIKQEGIVLDVALFAVAAAVLVVARPAGAASRLALTALGVAATGVPWQASVRARGFHDADIAPSLARSTRQLDQLPEIAPPARSAARLAQVARDRAAGCVVAASSWCGGVIVSRPPTCSAGDDDGGAHRRLPERPCVHPRAARALGRARRVAPVLLSAVALPLLLTRLAGRRTP